MLKKINFLLAIALTLTILVSCSEDSSTEPTNQSATGHWVGNTTITGGTIMALDLNLTEADDGTITGTGTSTTEKTGFPGVDIPLELTGTFTFPDLELTNTLTQSEYTGKMASNGKSITIKDAITSIEIEVTRQ